MLKRRIVLFLTSLLAVTGLYFFYAWIFVPTFMLPPLSLRIGAERRAPVDSPTEEIEALGQRYAKLLEPLFPDSTDWRRQNPRSIIPKENGGVFLFKGEPDFSANRRQITLSTCTIVIPLGPESLPEEERFRRALVLETRESATLVFSHPLELTGSLNLSTFEKGTLLGEVVVRSQMESPGPEDDFNLTTRDISFTQGQILANNEVVFHYGVHQGEGEGLRIELDTAAFGRRSETAPQGENPYTELARRGNLGGGFSIEWISLQKLNWLQFHLDSAQFGRSDGENDPMKVDIRCKNGLVFAPNSDEPAGWVVRFMEDVEVIVYHKTEKEDRLKCRNLYLYLTDPDLERELQTIESAYDGERPKRMPTGNLKRLTPTRIKAVRAETAQATLEIPGDLFEARGDEIVYEILNRRVLLTAADGSEPVALTRENGTVLARAVDYVASKEKGRVGILRASREGSLEQVLTDKDGAASRFRASWRDGIEMAPDAGNPNLLRLSLKGEVRLGTETLGEITAKEADFWALIEKRPDVNASGDVPAGAENAPGRVNGGMTDALFHQTDRIVPQSALFRGAIQIMTRRGIGTIHKELTIRFQEADPSLPAEATGAAGPNGAPLAANTEQGTDFLDPNASLFGGDSGSTFQMEGNQLDLWVIRGGNKQFDVARMILQTNIKFVETTLADKTETVRIEGDNVQIERPNSPNASLLLFGNPANFRGKGLNLSGYKIQVDRARNVFSVTGRGMLTFMPKTGGGDLLGAGIANAGGEPNRPTLPAQPIDVRWSRGMTFDGKTLSFLGDEKEPIFVQQKPTVELTAPELRFTLSEPVTIFDLRADRPGAAEIETSECVGTYAAPVSLVYYGSEATGAGGVYRGSVRNLRLENRTGEIRAGGPGFLRGVTRTPKQSADNTDNRTPRDLLSVSFPTNGRNDAGSNTIGTMGAAPRGRPWTHLHLIFNDGLTGNIKRNELTAFGRVHSVLATSDATESKLDAEDRTTFPPDAFYLASERLSVAKMIDPLTKVGSFELTATENTLFRYETFVGRGESLKYSDLKKTVVLEGNGVNAASIHRQTAPGAPVQSNRFTRGRFNLLTKKVEADIESTTLDALTPSL